MRAVVITMHGGPEVMEVRDWPEPAGGEGTLVVEVTAAGVNYRDVYEREGAGLYDAPTPLVAGVEGAGVVREGAGDFRPGDRVAWWQAPGSYAELAAVEAANAVPIPDDVSDEQAAAVLLQGMTAHYLCVDTYPVQPGEAVVVHAAAGGVGLLLTQMVRRLGGRVIATTSTTRRPRSPGRRERTRCSRTTTSPTGSAISRTAKASPPCSTGSGGRRSTRASRACARGGCSPCTGTRAGPPTPCRFPG